MIDKQVGFSSGVKAPSPVTDASKTGRQTGQTTPPAGLQNLQVGQHLMARVVGSWPEKNLIQLNLQGQTLLAQSSAKHSTGELLQLEVIKPGRVPELKVIPPSTKETALQSAARFFLPRQQPPLELLATLKNLKDALPANQQNTLKILFATEQLLQSIPKLSQLTDSKELTNAVRASGVFLEANLLTAAGLGQIPTPDYKMRLMELIQQFAPQLLSNDTAKKADKNALESKNLSLLTKMTEQAEGALASLIVNQLKSLPEKENTQTWVMQLPFFNNDELQELKLSVNEEGSSSSGENHPAWSVLLQLDPPDLGTIEARIRLGAGHLSLHFGCEATETANLISTHLTTLESRLRSAGLDLLNISVTQQEVKEDHPHFSQQLIDEQV